MEITSDIDFLKRDLSLRGYSDQEIEGLLILPVLFIPGKLTPLDSTAPDQKLTDQLAFVFKDIQKRGIKTVVAENKNVDRIYIEERHALIDLGTIVIGLATLGNLADVAQIIDLLITIIQLRFSKNKNTGLMPTTKYKLLVQNGKKSASLEVEGDVDKLQEKLPSKEELLEILRQVLK